MGALTVLPCEPSFGWSLNGLSLVGTWGQVSWTIGPKMITLRTLNPIFVKNSSLIFFEVCTLLPWFFGIFLPHFQICFDQIGGNSV
jgi:hypothetical protein